MSRIIDKKRLKRSPAHFFRIVLGTGAVILALAVGVMSSEDDGFLFLIKNHTAVGSALTSVLTAVTTTLNSTAVSTTVLSGTSGAGMNTLLISKMNEGYAKDYLSICLENVEGTLDTTKRENYSPISVVIGTNVGESKTYGCGLPMSDIPADGSGAPKYDFNTYSLYNWDIRDHTREKPALPVGGALQYTADNRVCTPIHTVSKYNQGTSSGGGEGTGDCYLFPDAVCGLNGYLEAGLNTMKMNVPGLSDTYKLLVNMISHNRGQGTVPKYMYGIPFNSSSGSRLTLSADLKDEQEKSSEEIVNDMASLQGIDKKTFFEAMGYSYSYFVMPAILYDSGWYFSSEFESKLRRVNSSVQREFVKCWNTLHPKEQFDVNNFEGVLNKLRPRFKTLAEVTGYSAADCDRIYGTTNGAYNTEHTWTSVAGACYSFKVTDRTSTAYTNKVNGKDPKIVYVFCGIQAQHIQLAACASDYIFDFMLKYAGVTADTTNINSGIGNGASTGTSYKPTGSSFEKTLQSWGVDLDKLTQERLAFLQTAYQINGTRYVYGASHIANVTLNESAYDCSSFVSAVVRNCGLPGAESFTCSSSSGMLKDTKTLYTAMPAGQIDIDKLLPGDIFCSNGHVGIFLGINNGIVTSFEATNSSKTNGYRSGSRTINGSSFMDNSGRSYAILRPYFFGEK